jgi:hypothetical protein
MSHITGPGLPHSAITLDEFFGGKAVPKYLFGLICREMEAIDGTSLVVTKSQIAFRRRRSFAWVWMPEHSLKRQIAPLVLSIALPWPDNSSRWKQVVEPSPGRYMHHLELRSAVDIDEDVADWLRQAWEAAI